MSEHKSTPDERFLIKLFEMASSKGNPLNEIKSQFVAQAIGQTEKSTKNIIKLLSQANFVKKGEGSLIHLTKQGLQFVERELSTK